MARKFKFEVIPVADVPIEDAVALSEEKKPLVLVVDDERIIADTLSIILSRNGFSTVTAYDGLAGLELAQSVRPDLLISDVMMPGMTGVELAIALTHAIPTCRILLFSGQAATVDLLEKAREAGHAFTTLAKPVHPTDMLKRVRDCLSTQHAATYRSSSPAEDSSQLPTFLVN
jgi:CheY-like chemotaxis protein